ncbi:MAG: phosphopantothenoylcysteine decarboxylase [Planctomycetes bacterium]|nr:phosphopantothenoylcysteine decarboxylase [Planctomycetota bacterium]
MRILVTAGPTREHIDDVRFISNPSTGKMGFACAEAARDAGHRVTLVTGPVDLPDPKGVRTVRVTSAEEMRRVAMTAYASADAVIAAAAVSDYRPVRRARGKIKKGPSRVTLELVRTPDILAAMGRRKGRRTLIGFALEASRGRAHALEKLRAKNLDSIVLNAPSSFGVDRMDAVVLHAGGASESFRGVTKRTLARLLVRLAEASNRIISRSGGTVP